MIYFCFSKHCRVVCTIFMVNGESLSLGGWGAYFIALWPLAYIYAKNMGLVVISGDGMVPLFCFIFLEVFEPYLYSYSYLWRN